MTLTSPCTSVIVVLPQRNPLGLHTPFFTSRKVPCFVSTYVCRSALFTQCKVYAGGLWNPQRTAQCREENTPITSRRPGPPAAVTALPSRLRRPGSVPTFLNCCSY